MRRVNQGRWIAVVVLAVGGVLVSSHGGAGKWLAGLLLASLGALLGRILWLRWAERSREAFVKDYRFPPGLARKLRDTYPHLSEGQAEMVLRELRNFFHVARAARGQMVSMPSQAVDVAWHEFILFTRGYQRFCSRVIGRFLHHTPAEHMASGEVARQGLRRTWRHACHNEGIDPKNPDRLPRLFAIDALLAIPDGFRYDLDCARKDGTAGAADSFCASDFGCGGSGCGGDGDAADGGDGGGDGGGGCGGD